MTSTHRTNICLATLEETHDTKIKSVVWLATEVMTLTRP